MCMWGHTCHRRAGYIGTPSASERSTALVTRESIGRVIGSPKKSRPAVFTMKKRHVSSFIDPGAVRVKKRPLVSRRRAPHTFRVSPPPRRIMPSSLLSAFSVHWNRHGYRSSSLPSFLMLCQTISSERRIRTIWGAPMGSAPELWTYMGTTISGTSIIVPPKWGVLLGRVPCYNLAKE